MTDMILPEGWVEARLGDVFFIKNGYAFKSSDFVLRQKDSYPVIRISDMRDGVVNDTNSTHILLKNISDIFLINNGDLLIAMSGATTGKIGVYQNNNPAYLNQRVGNVKPYSTKYSCNEFRNLLFMLLKGDILKIAYGGAQPNISSSRIESLFIKLPPLAEQEEIAQRVDRAIGHVDELKSRLETLLTTLKTFRQSVLNTAVTGKLTENWNVSSKTRNIELLSQIGCLERGKSKHRPRNDIRLFGNKYPFIQTGEIAQANEIVTEATKFYSDFGLQQSKLFSKGTLCITIAANIADTAILGINACFPDSIVGFTPDLSKCCVKYVKYFIDINKENLERFAPATAQKNINLKILNLLEISLPPLEEQEEIVKRVEAYFALADQIEKQVQSALDKVNLLTQSILAKAFRGELTNEWRQKNPELISGENSAEALLKRIKAEKDALEKPSKKTKNTKVKVT